MNRVAPWSTRRPVVLTGKNPGSAWFLPTFKIGCEVPTLQYVEATTGGLAKIRANYGTEVMAVTFDPKSVTWTTGTPPAPTVISSITGWEQPLQRVPSTIGVDRPGRCGSALCNRTDGSHP